jgi:hypothetical protein
MISYNELKNVVSIDNIEYINDKHISEYLTNENQTGLQTQITENQNQININSTNIGQIQFQNLQTQIKQFGYDSDISNIYENIDENIVDITELENQDIINKNNIQELQTIKSTLGQDANFDTLTCNQLQVDFSHLKIDTTTGNSFEILAAKPDANNNVILRVGTIDNNINEFRLNHNGLFSDLNGTVILNINESQPITSTIITQMKADILYNFNNKLENISKGTVESVPFSSPSTVTIDPLSTPTNLILNFQLQRGSPGVDGSDGSRWWFIGWMG